MKCKCDSVGVISLTLVIIGGLNWGLVGLFDFDLVAYLLGDMSTLARIVYTLVGAGALYLAIMTPVKNRK
ncbi:DUF378 domain-containing protein [Patescibacteria group bacterium]|nr:DUF378 domain-containing protein [Patescibacteria group bacterium]